MAQLPVDGPEHARLAVLQLFGALPSGAKAAVTAKPGDEDFKEKVINAAKGAGLVLGNLMAYLAKTELFAGPLLGAYKHIGPALTLDSTKVSVSVASHQRNTNQRRALYGRKGASQRARGSPPCPDLKEWPVTFFLYIAIQSARHW